MNAPSTDQQPDRDLIARIPPKVLTGITIGIGVLLIATVVVCLLIWITPPMQPIDIPAVAEG